jgi:hypothetical protein
MLFLAFEPCYAPLLVSDCYATLIVRIWHWRILSIGDRTHLSEEKAIKKGRSKTMPSRREDDLSESEDALSRSHKKRTQGRQPASLTRSLSAIIGVIFFVVAIAGFAWYLAHQQQLLPLPALSIPGIAPTRPSMEQIPPLFAAGITLSHPTQTPGLNQRQALLIASQLEPEAAANAQNTSAQYVLLNYSTRDTPAAPSDLNHVPTWMILYQGIPLQPGDPSVDPTPFPQSHYDLYVFLNAKTGKELLAIWV